MTDRKADAAYERLLDRFVARAEAAPDLRGIVVLGSRARERRPADEWSDLDLVVVTTDPDGYLSETDWLSELGTPVLTFLESTATGDGTERRVLFEGGLDVDFVLVPPGRIEAMERGDVDPEVAETFARGFRVAYDEGGIGEALAAAVPESPPETEPPSGEEFRESVADFWYHAVWAAKKLRRGERWTAMGCVDGYMKHDCLLPMIRWHARARTDRDTWHGGRFLEEWADDRAVDELGDAFARYDADDLWRALFATMDLFRWVAEEVGGELGFKYPIAEDAAVTEIVEELFEEKAD
ncbi:aminoglycoside 6-adenylyltransferase [Haladaptatus salinisoli]|uniref:aminoglycoside 6-adenylyltransferase n=1 Tax=Haladaptatus salinisoli TaxID=2884876 RepID=UPI001D0B7019|nr:aminoglycoside 6-adenylyltransferase [Haladaptatus salinisoli]